MLPTTRIALIVWKSFGPGDFKLVSYLISGSVILTGGDCDFLAHRRIYKKLLPPLNAGMGPGRTRRAGAVAAGPLTGLVGSGY